MPREAPMVVQRVEPRRFDGRLRTHVEDRDVEENLERLLVLTVSARTAERHERLAVAQDDGGREGRSRSLTALNEVGVAVLVQHERLHPIPEWHAGVPSDENAAEEPARRGGGRKQISSRVDNVHVGRVGRRCRGTGGRERGWGTCLPARWARGSGVDSGPGVSAMRAWLELPRITRLYRIVRPERVDEGAPRGRVWL